MLTREKKILELLYQSGREWTTTELANALHVSPRTVKTDIQRLKEELRATGCALQAKAGKGLWLSWNEEGKQYLDRLLSDAETPEAYDPEARKYYIALQLLDSDGFLSMESISDSLYVSKGTIVNDLNRLEAFFQKQGLVLERKVKYGVRVLGEERNLRIARAHVIRSIIAVQGSAAAAKLQPFFEGIDLGQINELLQDSEEKFGFVLTDASYSDMLTHLAIIVKRLRRNRSCAIEEASLADCRNQEEWPASQYMGQRLQEAFGVELSDGDTVYIAMNLSAAKKLKDSTHASRGLEHYQETSSELVEALEKVVEKADETYGEHLLQDNTFKTAFFVHLIAMFNRLRNRIHLENPLKNMVKEELAYEFEVAAYIAGLLYQQFQIELGENEICDIALYVGASLVRERALRRSKQPRVMICCSSGVGTSQFVEAKLRSYFPFIQVEQVLPASRLSKALETRPVDFIISTVPLTLTGYPTVVVSPLLGSNDIAKIRAAIENCQENPVSEKNVISRNRYSHLFRLMNERVSIMKCDCRSKEEAIELLGGRLYREGYVDAGFIESVFMRENLAPTSIGYSFAIPHAYTGHIRKQGIGLMTLKHPIPWGKDEKVQIILMLSIDVKLSDSFKDIFAELADLTKDLAAVDRILKADRLSEILRFLDQS